MSVPHCLIPSLRVYLHVRYAIEGAVASCAVGINWFHDSLGMLGSPAEISKLAAEVSSAEGLYFVSAFSGLLAPHWRDE